MSECQGTRPTRRCQPHFYLSPRLFVDVRGIIGPRGVRMAGRGLPSAARPRGLLWTQPFSLKDVRASQTVEDPRYPPCAFTAEVVEGDAVRYVPSSGRTPVLKQGAYLLLRSRKDAIFCQRRRGEKGGLSRVLPTRRDTAVLG